MKSQREWWVYVIRSLQTRTSSKGKPLPGFHYVGASTDPPRRLRQHNGEIKGGGKYTSRHRPWTLVAIYGPYANQSECLKAERALKKGKRGANRALWSAEDSPWCRGPGPSDPRIKIANDALDANLRARAEAGLPAARAENVPLGGRSRRSRRRRRKAPGAGE